MTHTTIYCCLFLLFECTRWWIHLIGCCTHQLWHNHSLITVETRSSVADFSKFLPKCNFSGCDSVFLSVWPGDIWAPTLTWHRLYTFCFSLATPLLQSYKNWEVEKQQSVVHVCTFCTPLFLWGQPWEVWTRYKCKQLLDRWVSVVL